MSEITDAQVMEALGWEETCLCPLTWEKDGKVMYWMDHKPATNTDDALALVPDGVEVFLNKVEFLNDEGNYWHASIVKRRVFDVHGDAPTLTLAICKALIELTQKEK